MKLIRVVAPHFVAGFETDGTVRRWESLVEKAGLATDNKRHKVVRHTLRHTAITWYLDAGVDIELVSQYCRVSVETIRKTYRHETPRTFDNLLSVKLR